jgi:zinc transport system permease protein
VVDFFTDLTRFTFLKYALVAGVLGSVACGIVGTYITSRRIVSIAGAIAHSTLGGMGAAVFVRRTWGIEALTPLHGAAVAALMAAVVIGLLTIYGKQREDTVLSAVWAIGMAVGILFISRTQGYATDLMSYLFGNILMVRKVDLWVIGGLDVVVVCVGLLFYNKLQALCFDEEYARLRGVHTGFFFLLLLCLAALTIVVLIQVVGIVMVIALLALPAATAGHLTRRLWQMMALAVVLCSVYTTGGLALSYAPDLPAGATIIVLAGTTYLLVIAGRYLARRLAKRRGRETLESRIT